MPLIVQLLYGLAPMFSASLLYGSRLIEGKHRIPGKASRAVPYPLPPGIHGNPHVQLDLAHLKRGGVAVTHQVTDQPPILMHLLGALPIRDPRRLHHRVIISHVVDHPDEAVVQNGEGLSQDGLHCLHPGAF